MGLNTSYLNYIESTIEKSYGQDISRLQMLELGDQLISDPIIYEKTGKEYFINRGYEHVSVDLNGRHGAIVRDLTKPEQFFDWHNTYDIITNSGTTEHVEPFENQYEAFSILHDCLKVGGIAIHLIPDVQELDKHGAWKNHCRYYYSEQFFELLANECEYEMLSNTVINGLRCAALRKSKSNNFMNDRSMFLSAISQREYHPSNSHNLVRKVLRRIGLGRLLRKLGLRNNK